MSSKRNDKRNDNKPVALKPQRPEKVTQKTPEVVEAPVVVEPVVEAPTVTPVLPVEATEPAPVQYSAINISSARVRRHLDKMNMNRELDTLLKPLKCELVADAQAKKALTDGFEVEQVMEEQVKTNDKGKEVKVKVPKAVNKPLSEERKLQLQAQVDAFAPRLKEVTDKVVALSKEKIRFSSDAPAVLSITFDELIQQLLEHAMDRVLLADKKIIQISHLHEEGVDKLPLYPLVKTLPSWTRVADEFAKTATEASLAAAYNSAYSQAERDFRKKYASLLSARKKKAPKTVDAPAAEPVPEAAAQPVVPPADPVEAVEQPEEQHDVEEDHSEDGKDKTTFNFYVNNACRKLIKLNDRYKKVRVSTDIRKYLSTLLIELVTRLSTLIKLTTDTMKVKTVNKTPILNTIRALLVDGHTPTESVTFVNTVPDPEALKLAQSKREESLKARKAAKAEGKPESELPPVYNFDLCKLPRVEGLAVERTVTFETSRYDQLYKTITARLLELSASSDDTHHEKKLDVSLTLSFSV